MVKTLTAAKIMPNSHLEIKVYEKGYSLTSTKTITYNKNGFGGVKISNQQKNNS